MDKFGKYAMEAVAAVWLGVVSVQFLCSYILSIKTDLSWAYFGMICLIAVSAGLRLARSVQPGESGQRIGTQSAEIKRRSKPGGGR